MGAAGALCIGRGQTINNLHCSEFAFWSKPDEALTSLTEAVPGDGRIVIESTANGMGNYFHDLWVAARNGDNAFATSFYVWHEHPEYSIPPDDEESRAWSEQLRAVGLPARH